MARLRGAIVGFGNVAARGHWPAFESSSDLEIVAVADPSPARRAMAGVLAGRRLPSFASIEDLADSGPALDFVDIATPPSSHASLASFALGRGWHVACEKPLALDPGVFARLCADARAADRALFTMHNWKAAPIFRSAFGLLRAGAIGAVRHVDLLVLRNQPCKGAGDWREDRGVAGGGILVDHGWHAFYLLCRLVGAEPSCLSARVTRIGGDLEALDDSARVVVGFPSADAFVHLTWRARSRSNAVLVHGECGTLVLDDDRLVVTSRERPPEMTVFPGALSAGSHHDDWFRALLPEFVREVREPGERGANLREAGWCVALTEAAYRSEAGGGKTVAVTGIPAPALST